MEDAAKRKSEEGAKETAQVPQSKEKGWQWLAWSALILIVMAGIVAWAYLSDPGAPIEKKSIDFVATTAPFVALAAALERFWEALFDWYERFALASARVIGVTASGTGWMTKEVSNAEKVVSDLVTALGATQPDSPEYSWISAQFAKAEGRLIDAKERITDILKSAQYVALKRAITVFGSLVIGVVISIAAKLTLLNSVGFGISAPVDMLVTGLLIGSGPGPMHAFIGTLMEFRNSVASLADSIKGGAVKKTLEGLQQAAGTASASTTSVTTPASSLVVLARPERGVAGTAVPAVESRNAPGTTARTSTETAANGSNGASQTALVTTTEVQDHLPLPGDAPQINELALVRQCNRIFRTH